jgi:two-component system phosphate regulon sensor histidine kinase PhoR
MLSLDRLAVRAYSIGFLTWAGSAGLIALAITWIAGVTRAEIAVCIAIIFVAGAIGLWRGHRAANQIEGLMEQFQRSIDEENVPVGSLENLVERAIAGKRQAEMSRELAIDEQRFVAARLETIVTGLRDGVLIIDDDLNIVSINPAACSQFMTDPVHAISRPLVEIARDYDLVRIAEACIQRGAGQDTPIDFRRAGRQFNVRVAPIDGPERRLAVVVVQDVTETRQLENVRKDFVANVSHELRTPLASIRLLVETLADGAIDDPDVSMVFLNRVVNEVDRLNELIEDLLDLGRLESGRLPLKRSRVSVERIVSDAVERVHMQANDAQIRIVTEVDPSLPDLEVDISRMEQVMANLLANAIKFSPIGSEVLISAGFDDNGVWISVQDHGEGILPEDLPRIFERFYKSDRARISGGTGLGLAIAKHIVGAHGGTLSAESEFEKGSLFTVRLPAEATSAAA